MLNLYHFTKASITEFSLAFTMEIVGVKYVLSIFQVKWIAE